MTINTSTYKTRQYNDPNSNPSSIGEQLKLFKISRRVLIEEAEKQVFTQLADVENMPKNTGKKIKCYVWIPLLDDRNVNDQGIDANGVTITDGNLYGSSKDIGLIKEKLPTLTEIGGRVNRVGYTRKTLEGTFQNYGFFDEFTEDSIQFDSQEDLMEHIYRERIRGAMEITEDVLQIDLLNAASTIRYAGVATKNDEIDEDSIVTYQDFMRLGIDLDNNNTPKNTKIIAGSRYVDTKVVPAARAAYCGSELIPIFKAMKDLHGNAAFVPVEHYAAAGTLMAGEIGRIDAFRIIIVSKMLRWSGAGADTAGATDFYETDGKFDVFPILVVGGGSFTCIGFKTDGKTVNFNIKTKMPGSETVGREDPYGKLGLSSIQWWYGFMALRPERIGIIKTAATL